jgi:HEAT repeat protein
LNNQRSSDLLNRLRSHDPAIQAPAIVEAEKSRAHEAAPIIAELLKSGDVAIRSSAAQALGYLGANAASRYGPALLPLLNDVDSLVRSCAAESLGALAYEPAVASLGRLLNSDPDELVRTSAAEALGAFDGGQVLAFARRGLGDPDPSVRAYAVQVIGRSGDMTFLPILGERLATESAFQPKAALLGARYLLGSNQDLPRLLALLDGAEVEQATIVLNVIWEVIVEGTPSLLLRDAKLIRQALATAKQNNSLTGRHADKVLQKLATKLGASPN